jgi:hypothetical protein
MNWCDSDVMMMIHEWTDGDSMNELMGMSLCHEWTDAMIHEWTDGDSMINWCHEWTDEI